MISTRQVVWSGMLALSLMAGPAERSPARTPGPGWPPPARLAGVRATEGKTEKHPFGTNRVASLTQRRWVPAESRTLSVTGEGALMNVDTATPANPSGAESREFIVEALVDFPDDALLAGRIITPEHVDNMMRLLKELGIRRVIWGYYADGHGGLLCPENYAGDYLGGVCSFRRHLSHSGQPS